MPFFRVLALVLLVAACDSGKEPPQARFEPVVVYAAYDDEAYLPSLFEAFTKETRIPVTVRLGDATELVDDVVANRGAPPADVLLTTNVADVWRAADEGALRPIAAGKSQEIPAFLRDPDDLWVAARMSVAVIAHGAGASADKPESYAQLASPAYSGQLCLSSSALPGNRALVAMLFVELGKRPAERVVRGWVRNLAQPVFESERELLDAVADGTCPYAIAPSHLVDEALRIIPQPAYVGIEGLGIARHARYPESAQRLVNWMLSEAAQARHADGTRAYPAHARLSASETAGKISEKNVGLAGWHDTDAVLLAERAGYR